jgi:UDP:flavonoid glycosyltransferase YjiC (YdhE family)
MRVLVASTGGAGHYNPLVPFVDSLARRGDDLLLVVPPELEAVVAATGLRFRIGASPPAAEAEKIRRQLPVVPALDSSILGNRELFGRLCTAAMLPTMEAAFASWQPDLVVREPCEYASAVVACRMGLPQVQVAISQAEVEEWSIGIAAPALEPYGPGVVGQLRASPYLTRFPAALDPSPFPDTRRFREAVRPASGPLPDWWHGSVGPLVYLTYGSITGGLSIAVPVFRAALDAVAGLEARVLLTVGRGIEVDALGPVPENVHVEAWVPQHDVLSEAAAVVCHGGSGTTFGALAAGVPLVIVPLFADQPTNGALVAKAGAGVVVGAAPRSRSGGPGGSVGAGPRSEEPRVPIGPGDAPSIRAAIELVLGTASFRQAARRIAADMRAQPTVDSVVASLAAEVDG